MFARRISRSVYRRQASKASASVSCSDKEVRVSSLNAIQRSPRASKAATNIDTLGSLLAPTWYFGGAELKLFGEETRGHCTEVALIGDLVIQTSFAGISLVRYWTY